ncbi:uncharacterized protein N7483_002679 [Penicillium malachiteum]|uniref:uncharacterized protein n=1 Tax=Penicillium malachiteum TaxID=1324776 RepID=UPI0025467F1B|nr:uncharacterized protein N7483_002679 [Penicillium malachiteum]KAJ5737554.1 hypothetical protein N7483_002679 [Penicillium malachiteum]
MTLSLETVAAVAGLDSPDSVIEICTTNFVSLFDGMIRVAHFCVQEFLVIPEAHSHMQHHECQFHMVDGCRFLATKMVDCLLEQTTGLTREEALGKPCFLHAAKNWYTYVDALGESDPLRSDLQPNVNRLFTEPEVYFNWERVWDDFSEELSQYDQAEFGNPTNQPIQLASGMGIAQTVQELLDRGFGSALTAASPMGHEGVVKLLLGAGASISSPTPDSGPLTVASAAGYESIVGIILDHITDIEAFGTQFCTSLTTAAGYGYEGIVNTLLDRATDLNGPNVCGEYPGIPPIASAASRGHEKIVRILVDRGADVNVESFQGETMLQNVTDHGDESLVKFLLDHGADPNALVEDSLNRDSPLRMAISHDNERLCEILLKADHGADVNADGGSSGAFSFAEAARYGHLEVMQLLLDRGVDINARGSGDITAIAYASYEGSEEALAMLLKRGAKIDWTDLQSPLALASNRGHERIVQLLLDQGGEVDLEGLNNSLVDGEGNSALSAVSQQGDEKIVQLLLERGANVNHVDENGLSALQLASGQGHEEIVRMLLKPGADVNSEGSEKTLVQASQQGHGKIVHLLLLRGADINQVDGDGHSALSAASMDGSEEIVEMLLKRGADVNLCNNEGDSALQCASDQGSESIVQMLLDGGAQIDCKGSMGSALQLAASQGHEDTVKLLLDRGADVNVQGGNLESAIQEASSNGYEEIVQLLRDRGAELNEQ